MNDEPGYSGMFLRDEDGCNHRGSGRAASQTGQT